MNIVILDGYTLNPGDLSWKPLEAMGTVTVYDRTAKEDILQRAADAEILFTNKTPLTAQTMMALPNLRYVGVLATGYNVVDVAAAKCLGITVTNVPTYGTAAVAQMTFALLLELCHHVGDHNQAVRAGAWSASPDFSFWLTELTELEGLTMGIIGFGRIGQHVACIAVAFGMHVLVYEAKPNPQVETSAVRFTALDRLLAESDIISLHCPLTPETEGMINAKTIARMKPGAMLLNTARGPLVDEAAVVAALENGHLKGAAFDVVHSEPIPAGHPYLTAKNLILTPHIAWAPRSARNRLLGIAVDNLRCFLANHPVNVVS